jgi:hypothetical protein
VSLVRPLRPSSAVAVTLLLCLLAAPTWARAGAFTGLRGHVAIGYSKLVTADGPGGSMAGAVGLDLPVTSTLRAGIELDLALLGTRTVEDSIQIAELDYSLGEVLALVHWRPTGAGPIGRVSLGTGVFAPRVEQSSAAPASFEKYTLRGARPGIAAAVSLMPSDQRPLAAGVELALRYVFVPDDDWLVTHLRFVVHY